MSTHTCQTEIPKSTPYPTSLLQIQQNISEASECHEWHHNSTISLDCFPAESFPVEEGWTWITGNGNQSSMLIVHIKVASKYVWEHLNCIMTTVWLSIVHWVAPPSRGDEYDSSEPVCAYVMVIFTEKKQKKRAFQKVASELLPTVAPLVLTSW